MKVGKQRMRPLVAAVLFLAGSGLGASAPAAGQQALPQVSTEKLAAYAKAFDEVQSTYEVGFQDRLGRAHDELAKAAIREEFETEMARILSSNGLTAEEYQRITLLVSADNAQREAFEKALAEVRAAG